MSVRIGISAYDIQARDLVDLAVAADEIGFDTLWLGEHVVLPVGYEAEHPKDGSDAHEERTGPIVDPNTQLLDPLVALAGCATVTRSITFATGVYVAPLRHPLAIARMVHTLAQVSNGRFILGAGAGWLREEFDALEVPFKGRGKRMEEQLEIVRKALRGGPFAHDGERYQFADLQVCEEPSRVPVVLGGNSEVALRRAALHGDGWFVSGTPTLEAATERRNRLFEIRRAAGLDDPFPTYVRLPKPDPHEVSRYASAGFDEVIVWAHQIWPAEGDARRKRSALETWADRLGVSR